ncbi:MAG: phosphoadenosine phosphosulfate reductase family protein [archaeon]
MKEEKALKLIKKHFKQYNNPVVACSWGKDSITVLHMVYKISQQLNKPFDVLWNNTTIHYPSVYKIKKQLENKWNLNIIETKPEKTFWDIVNKYGFPGVGGSDRSDRANKSCCYYIKKKPTKIALDNNNWDLYFDGLTAYESDRRYLNLKEYGIIHHHKTFNLTKCHPIAWWTVNDVWDYLKKYNIPYPDVYDNEIDKYTKRGYSVQQQGHRIDRSIRNGCWCCTLTLSKTNLRIKQLRTYYPELWETLMKKGLAKEIAKIKLGGQGSLFDGFFNEDQQEHWLKNRPCFFDKI